MFAQNSVGATIVYEDPGIYGLLPRAKRVGKIVGSKHCRITGPHFLVEVAGFNLPRLVSEDAIISYTHPSLDLFGFKSAANAEAPTA